jgi:hypothetical protein
MNLRALVVAGLAGTVLAAAAVAGPYTPGNLVVTQFGPGQGTAGALNSRGTAVTLREFSVPGGAFLANDLTLNNNAANGTRFVNSGTATSEGQLTRSLDGRFLTLIGYDANVGAEGANAGSSLATSRVSVVNRVVARVDADQNTSLFRLTDAYDGSNARSAASIDGSTFITSGTAATSPAGLAATAGARSFDPSLGTTSVQLAPAPTNTRVVNYFNGDVYFSAQSTTAGVTGVYRISGGVATILPGFGSTTLAPTDFAFLDANTLYVADESNPTTGQGGLQKWTFDGTTWSIAYRITAGLGTSGLRSMTLGTDSAGNPLIYAIHGTSATNLVSIVDTGAASSATILATAPAGFAFRGVEFAVPTPGAASVLALAGLVAVRRRRA